MVAEGAAYTKGCIFGVEYNSGFGGWGTRLCGLPTWFEGYSARSILAAFSIASPRSTPCDANPGLHITT